MKQNKLTSIKVLQSCKIDNVKIIDFQDNKIEEVPALKLKKLQKLILKKNKISKINFLQNSFVGEIKILNLSFNMIQNMPLIKF